jgi:hypothetical protein
MFRAFERWTRKDTGGYATITNVNQVSGMHIHPCASAVASDCAHEKTIWPGHDTPAAPPIPTFLQSKPDIHLLLQAG